MPGADELRYRFWFGSQCQVTIHVPSPVAPMRPITVQNTITYGMLNEDPGTTSVTLSEGDPSTPVDNEVVCYHDADQIYALVRLWQSPQQKAITARSETVVLTYPVPTPCG